MVRHPGPGLALRQANTSILSAFDVLSRYSISRLVVLKPRVVVLSFDVIAVWHPRVRGTQPIAGCVVA
jgi:hypothetical protein